MPLPGMGGLTAAQQNQQIDRSRREAAGGGREGLTKYQRLLEQQKAQAATNRPAQAGPTTRPSQPIPGAPVAPTGPILPTPTVAAAPAQTTRPMQPGVPVQPQVLPPSPGPVMSPAGPALGPAMPAADFAPPASDARAGAAQLSADKQKQALMGGGYKPQYV